MNLSRRGSPRIIQLSQILIWITCVVPTPVLWRSLSGSVSTRAGSSHSEQPPLQDSVLFPFQPPFPTPPWQRKGSYCRIPTRYPEPSFSWRTGLSLILQRQNLGVLNIERPRQSVRISTLLPRGLGNFLTLPSHWLFNSSPLRLLSHKHLPEDSHYPVLYLQPWSFPPRRTGAAFSQPLLRSEAFPTHQQNPLLLLYYL